jgi:ornithine carbamoyltransferase
VSAFSRAASIPVINGLTDRSHPCQILADLMTMEERFGRLQGLSVAWIGDGNNVCTSFVHAAPLAGFRLRVCAPPGYRGSSLAIQAARAAGGDVEEGMSPQEAVAGADVVVTDTWISMGDTDREQRLRDFAPYQVTPALMALANPDAIFLHCLPAHRGEEVTAEVIDGPRSAIFDEAENRVHAQKAVLLWCLGRGGARL